MIKDLQLTTECLTEGAKGRGPTPRSALKGVPVIVNQAPRWSSHTPCYLYASSSSAQLWHSKKWHCCIPEAALHFTWWSYAGPLSQDNAIALAVLAGLCNITAEHEHQ